MAQTLRGCQLAQAPQVPGFGGTSAHPPTPSGSNGHCRVWQLAAAPVRSPSPFTNIDHLDCQGSSRLSPCDSYPLPFLAIESTF